MNPEAKLEQYLRSRIRQMNGMVLKLVPVVAGVPDDLVLLPGGRTYLVELKTAKGTRSPIQVQAHQRLKRLGHPVVTLHGQAEVDAWLDTLEVRLYPATARPRPANRSL